MSKDIFIIMQSVNILEDDRINNLPEVFFNEED